MEAIKQKTLEQAMRMLIAIECEYRIKDSDGVMHGDLELGKTYKRKLNHDFGSIAKFVHQYIDDMGVGAIAYIPLDLHGHKSISNAVCQIMGNRYGTGSYKIHKDKANNILEVIRYS